MGRDDFASLSIHYCHLLLKVIRGDERHTRTECSPGQHNGEKATIVVMDVANQFLSFPHESSLGCLRVGSGQRLKLVMASLA